MIKIKTNFPVAVSSADHTHPCGSVNDNNSNPHYVNGVKDYFECKKINVLDLGCSGGQIVVDHINRGDVAVGVEGSDTVLNGAGSHNWKNYLNQNLFLADITEKFELLINDELLRFDVVQMWDVLEHIPEIKLPVLFDNIKQHLKENGIFIGQISQQIDPIHHISVFPRSKWEYLFNNSGLTLEKYPIGSTPRPILIEKGEPGFHPHAEGFTFLSKKITT